MKRLIEALQIFAKYKDLEWPTTCEHDTLYVVGFERMDITGEDERRLIELGFFWSMESETWASHQFGSA
jgi:hypothetical protein